MSGGNKLRLTVLLRPATGMSELEPWQQRRPRRPSSSHQGTNKLAAGLPLCETHGGPGELAGVR
eukprot:12404163-Karenia_brevis.AAC.1